MNDTPIVVGPGQKARLEFITSRGRIYCADVDAQAMYKRNEQLEKERIELREENERLRKLVKDAPNYMPWQSYDCKKPKSGKGSQSGCRMVTCPSCSHDAEQSTKECVSLKFMMIKAV